MKKVFLTTIILSIITLYNSSYAQGVKLGLGGGLTSLQSPDYYTDEDGFGFSSEYHFGAKIKFDIPLVPFTPYGHITYHKFSGETPALLGSVDVSQSVFQIGVGGEMQLVPGPISPYLGLEVAYNNFGDIDIDSSILPGDASEASSSRFGLGLAAGTELTIIPFVNFDVSVKYNWFNLIGKDDGEETVSALSVNVLILFSTM